MSPGAEFAVFRWSCLILIVTMAVHFGSIREVVAQVPERQVPDPARTGIGWSSVVPQALLGVAVFRHFGDSAWGLYLDGKMSHDRRSSHSDFQDDLTVASLEARYPSHRRLGLFEWEEWVFLNAGVTYSFSPFLSATLGGGMARQVIVNEFLDGAHGLDVQEGDFSQSGVYFVKDEERSGWLANGMFALLFRVSERIAVSAGFETAPTALAMGAFILFD